MSAATKHAEAARALLESAGWVIDNATPGTRDERAADHDRMVARAQVHALLALAPERIEVKIEAPS